MRFLALFVVSVLAVALLYGAVCTSLDATLLGEQAVKDSEFSYKACLFRRFQSNGPVDCLILGSSRSMKINPETIRRATGLRTFNFALSGAKVEDYLAAYRWAASQPGVQLALLLIGLDIDGLHGSEERYPDLKEHVILNRLTADVAWSWTDAFSAYKQYYSIGWLLPAAKGYLRQRRGEPGFVPADFEPDGYFHYTKWEALKARGEFDASRVRSDLLIGYEQKYQAMQSLSPTRKRCFEAILNAARARSTGVKVWLPPFRPALERKLRAAAQLQQRETETCGYLRELQSAGLPFEFHDFTSVESFGGLPDDWYDSVHMGESNADLISRRLFPGSTVLSQ